MSTSTDARSPIPRSAWKVAILGGMASYLDGGALITGGIAFSLAIGYLGLTPWDVGVLSSLLTGGLAVGALIGGRLGDRFGRRRVLSIDLAILAVGLAINLTAVNPGMLYVGVIITGLAMGADLPVSIALVAEQSPREHRGKLVALSQLLWGVGPLVVILLNVILSNLLVPGEIVARVLWGHLVVVAVVVWILRRGLKESSEWLNASRKAKSGSSDDKDEVTDAALAETGAVNIRDLRSLAPFLVPLAATGLFYTIGNLAPNTGGQFNFFILTEVAGLQIPLVANLMLTIPVVGIVLGVVFMRIVDTKWRYPVMIAAGIVQILSFAVPAVIGVTAVSYLAAFYGSMIANAFIGEALYKVRTQEIFPTLVRSTAQGLTIFICRMVAAVFALVTPAIAAASLGALLWIMAGFNAVTLVLGIWLSRIPKAEEPAIGSAMRSPERV